MSITTRLARESAAELELWRSNEVLPEIVQERVRKLLSEALEDMDGLDLQIASSEGAVQDLEVQKDANTAPIKNLREAISPFKKVPNETLLAILSYCRVGSIILPLSMCAMPPWRLGHVCSQWKNAIWNVPPFWSNIIAFPDRGGINDRNIRGPLYDIMLKTNILLDFRTGGFDTPALLDFIISWNHRFHTLSFPISGNQALSTFLRLHPHAFANLESFEFLTSKIILPLGTFQTTFFENASKLRRFAFHTYDNIPIFEHLWLPFWQLTEFVMPDLEISSGTMYSILQKTRCLIFCDLKLDFETAPMPNISPIVLQYLRKLSLTLGRFSSWDHVFEPLIAPSLKVLSLNSSWGHVPPQAITSFLRRSHCNIHTLSINPELTGLDIWISDQELEALFHETPSLQICKTAFLIPNSIFRKIQDCTLLPKIWSGSWRLQPEGLDAFMDFVDSCILKSRATRPIQMEVGCYTDEGYEAVRQRFKLRIQEYKKVRGIDVKGIVLPVDMFAREALIDNSELEEDDNDDSMWGDL